MTRLVGFVYVHPTSCEYRRQPEVTWKAEKDYEVRAGLRYSSDTMLSVALYRQRMGGQKRWLRNHEGEAYI